MPRLDTRLSHKSPPASPPGMERHLQMCPHRHVFHLLQLSRSCGAFAGTAQSPAESTVSTLSWQRTDRLGKLERKHTLQAWIPNHPLCVAKPTVAEITYPGIWNFLLFMNVAAGCRNKASYLCCAVDSQLCFAAAPASPRPLENVDTLPPHPGPEPLKLAFWHTTPATQLDTHLFHLSGYN